MYYYIVNPAAGGGAITGIQDKLKASLRELKIDGEFAKTLGPGDAAKVTASAIDKGAKTIVAVGGGKTVNEVINAVYKQQKPDIAVGIIPIGKNNILAGALGINNWRDACEVLASRRLVEYSLVSVNDYVLVQSLIVSPSPPEEEETPETKPTWQKYFASKSVQPRTEINFKAQLLPHLKIRGVCAQISVYNQKFLYPELENKLLIQIQDLSAKPHRLLASMGGRFSAESTDSQYSQLHGDKFDLKTQVVCDGSLDGKLIHSKHFAIALTDWKLRMITNVSH